MSREKRKALRSEVLALMQTYNAEAPQVEQHAIVVPKYRRYTFMDRLCILVIAPAVAIVAMAFFYRFLMDCAIDGVLSTGDWAIILCIGIAACMICRLPVDAQTCDFLPLSDEKALAELKEAIAGLNDIRENVAQERELLEAELAAYARLGQIIKNDLSGTYQLYEEVYDDGSCDFYVEAGFQDENALKEYSMYIPQDYEDLLLEVAKRWLPQNRRAILLKEMTAVLNERKMTAVKWPES